MATPVKRKAEMKDTRSPKLSMPMARAPRMTVKLSHDRNVRSLAKKTLGSTRVGRAMRLPIGLNEQLARVHIVLRGDVEQTTATYQEQFEEEAEKTL